MMKVAVWDTYVKREDGRTMHFDILVPETLKDENIIFDFGSKYLNQKPFNTSNLTATECSFCHIQQAPKPIVKSIEENGFYIIEIEHCN